MGEYSLAFKLALTFGAAERDRLRFVDGSIVSGGNTKE